VTRAGAVRFSAWVATILLMIAGPWPSVLWDGGLPVKSGQSAGDWAPWPEDSSHTTMSHLDCREARVRVRLGDRRDHSFERRGTAGRLVRRLAVWRRSRRPTSK